MSRLTTAQMEEAIHRLSVAHEQIGHIPPEVVALLKTLLVERDVASSKIAAFLREVT